MNLENLTTERGNENTMGLDEMSIKEALQKMNQEDRKVTITVGQELAAIEPVVEVAIKSFDQGSRLTYTGAGTSGWLGVLDTTGYVPASGVEPKMVQDLIAGGQKAMTVAVGGVEDSKEPGHQDLVDLKLSVNDVAVGIAVSGRTPYVISGLEYVTTAGAITAVVACNKNAEISKYTQVSVEVDAGPKFLTGSTRLKSGTVQELILNMLSTISMISIGKAYNNLMADVKPTSEKPAECSKQIIMEATDCSYEVAELKSVEAEENVKSAIAIILTDSIKEETAQKLIDGNQFIKNTLN